MCCPESKVRVDPLKATRKAHRMLTIAFFDTKPYDREYFERAEAAKQLQIFRGFDDARVPAFDPMPATDWAAANGVSYVDFSELLSEDLSGEVLQDDELSRLLTFPNVLVTAHQAFLTREALSEIARVTKTNLLRYANQTTLIEGSVLVKQQGNPS